MTNPCRLAPTLRSVRSSWLGAPGELFLFSTGSSLAHHQHPRTHLHIHPPHARTHHHCSPSVSALSLFSCASSCAAPTTLVPRGMHGVFLPSSSGFPPFSWPALLFFFLLCVAPAALSFRLLRVAPCAISARTQKHARSDAPCPPANKTSKQSKSTLAQCSLARTLMIDGRTKRRAVRRHG